MGLIYDPPGGWRCGFPRAYEPLPNETLEQTLIRDGYPAGQAEFGARHCRFIGERDELDAMAQHHVDGDNDNQTPAEMLAAAVADAPVAAQAQPAGFVAGLTDEQRKAALAYRGEDGPIGLSPITRLRNAGGFYYLGSP